MEREEILKKLIDVIEQYLEVQVPEEVTEEHRVFEDLLIDSIMVLQLIVYIEEEFNVVVPDEGFGPEMFLTVGSLISLIEQLQTSQNPV